LLTEQCLHREVYAPTDMVCLTIPTVAFDDRVPIRNLRSMAIDGLS
jgi:hypothetical protein